MLAALTSAQVADWLAFYSLECEAPRQFNVEDQLRKAFGGPRT